MFFTPHTSKPSLKILLWMIGVCSFITPILSYFSFRSFGHLGPAVWLPLSWWGISKLYLWQLFSYIFVHSMGVNITISLLISVAFHLFLLWYSGSELMYRFGTKAFWWFFISSTLIGGAIGLLTLFLIFPTGVLVGSGPAVFALLTIWVMCYPDMEMALFFVLRMKAKWLVLILIAFTLFMHISSGDWPTLFAEMATILWAYIVGHWIWKLPHPYSKSNTYSM